MFTEPNCTFMEFDMTESEYTRLADETLRKLEYAIEKAAEHADFDYELSAGGVMEVEFADGSKIIINKQSASQEIWVAAKSGGFHFRWDGATWHDTRSNDELFAALSRYASSQAGEPVLFNQP
jgi:CyaY protein